MKKPAYKPCSQPLRCAIYARTATEKITSENNSITHQVATCKRFAKGRGWTVRRDCIFADSGHSGLTVNSALKDLMRSAIIKPKPFEVLLCTSSDRIARDTSLVIRIHKILKKYGVEIRFAEPAEELVCDIRRWRKNCGT
jgi:DNA invertase Pin-like site-specific DNA recombinase